MGETFCAIFDQLDDGVTPIKSTLHVEAKSGNVLHADISDELAEKLADPSQKLDWAYLLTIAFEFPSEAEGFADCFSDFMALKGGPSND